MIEQDPRVHGGLGLRERDTSLLASVDEAGASAPQTPQKAIEHSGTIAVVFGPLATVCAIGSAADR